MANAVAPAAESVTASSGSSESVCVQPAYRSESICSCPSLPTVASRVASRAAMLRPSPTMKITFFATALLATLAVVPIVAVTAAGDPARREPCREHGNAAGS